VAGDGSQPRHRVQRGHREQQHSNLPKIFWQIKTKYNLSTLKLRCDSRSAFVYCMQLRFQSNYLGFLRNRFMISNLIGDKILLLGRLFHHSED